MIHDDKSSVSGHALCSSPIAPSTSRGVPAKPQQAANAEPQSQLATSSFRRSSRPSKSTNGALPTQACHVVVTSHLTLPHIEHPPKPKKDTADQGMWPRLPQREPGTGDRDRRSIDGNDSSPSMMSHHDRRRRKSTNTADGGSRSFAPTAPAHAMPCFRRERFSGRGELSSEGGEPKASFRRRRAQSSFAVLDDAPRAPGPGTTIGGVYSSRPGIISSVRRSQDYSAVKTPMVTRRRQKRASTSGIISGGSVIDNDETHQRVSSLRPNVKGAISNRRHSFDTSDSFDISLLSFPEATNPDQIPPLNQTPVVDKEASRRSRPATVRFSQQKSSFSRRQDSAFDVLSQSSTSEVGVQDPRKSAQALEEMMEEMFGLEESMDFEAECKRMDMIKHEEQRSIQQRKLREQFEEEEKAKARLAQEAEEKRQEEEQYRRKLDIMGKLRNVSKTALKLMQWKANSIRNNSEDDGEVEARKADLVLEKQLQAVFESFCRHNKWMPDDVLLLPTTPMRNRGLKGMSVGGFVELSHQAGVQRVAFIKKVFESHCNQKTGRLDDMEEFVAAIVDLGKLQGWNPARSLQAFRSINKEGLLYIQQPGNE